MTDQPNTAGESGEGFDTVEHSTETTSVFLPVSADAGLLSPKLAPEEVEAIAALPLGSALLIAHTGPNSGARFLLDTDEVVVGRHPDADIFLDDVTVSRRHAVFARKGSSFELADTGSLNGSYVNHDRVDHVLLRNGNEVQIGKFRLTFYINPTRTAAQG